MKARDIWKENTEKPEHSITHKPVMSKIKRILHFFADPFLSIASIIKLNLLYIHRYLTLKNGLNNSEKRDKKIIVSVTSFPQRIKSCAIVISYLLSQTCKPDEIILYLAEDQFPGHKLPSLLRKEMKYGVKVAFCENLRSHKKYFFSMQQYSEDIVITIDDDFIYRSDLIEILMNGYKKNPKCISCLHASRMQFNGDSLEGYDNWPGVDEILVPSMQNVAIGLGGILYPPHCLHSEVFNKDAILRTCFNADDLWLKTMEVMNNIPVQKAGPIYAKYVPSSQNIALYKSNLNDANSDKKTRSNNDIQFENILNEYNTFFGKDDTLISRMKK